MKGVGPIDVAVFHESDVWVSTVVSSFKEAVIKAGVNHQQYVVKVKGMSDGVLVKQNLFFVLAKLFGNLVEIDDAVVYWLFISVILTDS